MLPPDETQLSIDLSHGSQMVQHQPDSAQLSLALWIDLSHGSQIVQHQPDSARLSSAQLGSARLGSARLGSARLGSARLGLAYLRLGSAGSASPAALGCTRLTRLDSAGLGYTRLAGLISAVFHWHAEVFRQVRLSPMCSNMKE